MAKEVSNGVTIRNKRLGVSGHFTWAGVAAALTALGILGGGRYLPAGPNAHALQAAEATIQKCVSEQKERDTAQDIDRAANRKMIQELREQNIRTTTVLDSLRDDIREIKMLLRRSDTGRTGGPGT